MKNFDEFWMQRAFTLAKLGEGLVEPNPMVGAVVLNAQGGLAGMGYHRKYGSAHAEVEALRESGPAASGGTLYVTLEPCSHHGKTPPCTDAVIQARIRRVVAAMADPFPAVAGRGVQQLREAKIDVTLGVLQDKAEDLNAPYLKLIQSGRPWVIGKWAMTQDGKLASTSGDSCWISNEASRAKVHALRGRVDAILVGASTLRKDQAQLTARPAGLRHRVATRVIVTNSGRIEPSGPLWDTREEAPILFATTSTGRQALKPWAEAGAELLVFDSRLASGQNQVDLVAMLHNFGARRWTNVLVEGGSSLLGQLNDLALLDETWVFVGHQLLGGSGAPSPVGGSGASTMSQARQPYVCNHSIIGNNVLITSRYRHSPHA